MVMTRATAARDAAEQIVVKQTRTNSNETIQSIQSKPTTDYRGRGVKVLQNAVLTGVCLATTIGCTMITQWQLDELSKSKYTFADILSFSITISPVFLISLPLRYVPQLVFGGGAIAAGVATVTFAAQTVSEVIEAMSN